MRKYEMLTILEAGNDETNTGSSDIQQIISRLGGNVTKTDIWGKRTLAYPIHKKTEGVYVLFSFELNPSQTFELRRILGLRANVYRHLIILLDN
ncbi:MAG: 30S ribosomal protein S6 [Synergistaceae bacterium]|nr:30S ribosomal protein S6 [Synergistaceae bacterium]MBQ3450513.1 30S ribosomal protein S6 [Synergistaceae bacterium]MBQ3693542.1 30S ribosomal protein S6 [Synergistaceae bacterium]MBQ6112060.1 30S ribosomal protein S6 [Synergistaceae bacterium]MBQ9628178.1 30S ribosomal protein S6 [Synergistaceae bacterium]